MPDRVDIDARGVESLERQLNESPLHVQKKVAAAANREMKRARGQVKKGVQAETGIKAQKSLDERRRFFLETINTSGLGKVPRDPFVRLWIGLSAIPARERYWGKARQETRGASLGQYYWPGGWIGYRASRLGAGVYLRTGRERFPIKIQGVEIDRPEVRAMINGVVDGTEQRFTNEVIRLLNVDWDKAAARSRAP